MIKYLDLKKINDSFEPELSQEIQRVVRSGWYLLGNEVKAFEQAFAAYCGTQHCIGVANGLDALILSFRALMVRGDLKPGDEVIVPANTYIASILAISRCGLKPVLCEPHPDNFLMDEDRMESCITSRTRAVLAVHLYGRMDAMDRIARIASDHGLCVVEDCAQAHGAFYKGKRAGAWTDLSAFSFYPGKNLGALGDGGAVTTPDEELAGIVRTLANYGSSAKYVFRYKGMNSRLDELHAAVLNCKLKRLDKDNGRRREIAALYRKEIKNPLVTLPAPDEEEQNNVYHIFPVLCGRRDEFQQFLKEQRVETLIHYPIPPHHQEAYKEWNGDSYPVTEFIHARELSLPISQVMTDEEAQAVVRAVNAFQ